MNVLTGPQFMMFLSIYGSEAALLATTDSHQQFIANTSDVVKDIFFYKDGVSALASTLVTDVFVTFNDDRCLVFMEIALGYTILEYPACGLDWCLS
ncbi:MAG: hypothetical protein VX054_00645 [Pseudomonadota bacterium]|nr:hypothetical protein [Pseudomonadota bacterium]